MRMRYDASSDALYMRFSEQTIIESEEIRPGIVLDFDSQGRIVGMEVLDAARKMPPDAIFDLQAAE